MPLLWGALMLLTCLSALLVALRLSDLPRLPVMLDPQLRVRSVLASQTPGSAPFQRDDRLVALRGRALEDLRELRAALDGISDQAPSEADHQVVAFQIVRPLHRFNLTLQGEPLDPSALPPGVEEGDQLVELDGRPMKPRVRTEGLRSIIFSRPEALLVFERVNAVFTGEVELGFDERPEEVLASFALALLLMALCWRRGHGSLSRLTPLATGVQTLAFAWCAAFIFDYQWVMGDEALTAAVIAALILSAPLGIFARTASAQEQGATAWGSLAIGALAVALTLVALKTGRLQDAEVALQFAAFLGALFVVFEVILTGLNESAGVLLGDRSRFLSFIVIAILLAAVIAYLVEPLEFVEERWRWFIVIVLGLVWIGDVQLTLGGLPAPPMASVALRAARREAIGDYLLDVREAIGPRLEPWLVVLHGRGATCYALEQEALTVEPASQAIFDAASILYDEDAHLPSLAGPSEEDLGAGLARSMGWALASPMAPPSYGLEVHDVRVVLLGSSRGAPGEEALEETIEPATLDLIMDQMSPSRWAALVIESLAESQNLKDAKKPASPELTLRAAPFDAESQGIKAPEESEALRGASRYIEQLEDTVALMHRYHQSAPALPARYEELLEEELLVALKALFVESSAPLVISGPPGSGKAFIAAAGHLIEGRQGACLMIDAALYGDEELESMWLPRHAQGDSSHEAGEGAAGMLGLCQGGSLTVCHAELLDGALMLAVSQACEQLDVRLYWCVDHAASASASPLEMMGPSIMELLGDREIVVPPLSRRHGIRPRVIAHYLEMFALHWGRQGLKVSPEAHDALLEYAWPGQVEELVVVLRAALCDLRDEALELSDLPEGVRAAHKERLEQQGGLDFV